MNETYMTTHGNVVADPVRRVTVNGDPYVTFRIASTVRRRRANSDEYYDAYTNYYDVVAFRQLAVNVAASLGKGQPVVVHGQQRIKPWSKGDKSGTDVEVEAQIIGHDLRRGTAAFERVTRGLAVAADPAQVPAMPAMEATGDGVAAGQDPARDDGGYEPERLAG